MILVHHSIELCALGDQNLKEIGIFSEFVFYQDGKTVFNGPKFVIAASFVLL